MSDIAREAKEIGNSELVVVGVGISGETRDSIEGFKAANGLDNLQFWIDSNMEYRDLVPPGGQSFPIDLVVGKDGVIRYLANEYYPGEAVGEAKKALAQ